MPNNSPLPPGWTWTTIGEVADTTSGGTPSRKNDNYYGGDIPWLKSGELGDGVIHLTEETITKEGLTNSSAKIFPRDTPLVALSRLNSSLSIGPKTTSVFQGLRAKSV